MLTLEGRTHRFLHTITYRELLRTYIEKNSTGPLTLRPTQPHRHTTSPPEFRARHCPFHVSTGPAGRWDPPPQHAIHSAWTQLAINKCAAPEGRSQYAERKKKLEATETSSSPDAPYGSTERGLSSVLKLIFWRE